jgi:hypothetical protein
MSVGEWVKSNVDYGRRIVGSGIEGARSGQDEFLDGKPLLPVLGESAKDSLIPAAAGLGVGLLIGYAIFRRKRAPGVIAYGLLGGLLGFGGGMAWENRHLGASVAGGAIKNIGKVRDEQWLTRNPIDYA